MDYGGATGASNENIYVDYGVGALDVTTTSFSIEFSGITNGDWLYFEGGDGDNNTMFSNGNFASAELMWGLQYDGSDDTLEYRNGGWQDTGITLSDSTQYDFHIVANNSASSVTYGANTVAGGTMDLYINGVLEQDNLAIEGGRDSIGMKITQEGDGSAVDFQFDDHIVWDGATAVPEPGTFALFAGLMGLVYVMVKRRRA